MQTHQVSLDLTKEFTCENVWILRESLQSVTISRRNTTHQFESRPADHSTDRGNKNGQQGQ